MSVYKRSNSPYWQYEFVFEGVRYRRSTKLRNKKAAERAESIHQAKLAQSRCGIIERIPSPTFRKFSTQFLESVQLERKANTHRCYQISVNALLPWFGNKRLEDISADDIRRFKESRLKEGRAGATVNRDLECLRRVLFTAMRLDLIVTHPFIARKIEFMPEVGRERVLTFTEEREYLKHANPLLSDIATIILEMGLRPEEVFSMKAEDVHLAGDRRFVHVPDGKTLNSRRDVAVTEKVLPILRTRLGKRKGPYLFPLRIGGGHDWKLPMKQLQPAHRQALADSKINPPFRLYDLRHTFGTRAAEAGTDPLTLARIMGHADLKTTQRYVHLSKRHLEDVQKKIQQFRIEREIAEAEATQSAPTARQ